MYDSFIFRETSRRFCQGEDIKDDMLYNVLDCVSDLMIEGREEEGWQECERLLDQMDKAWHYGKLEQLSAGQGYLYGGIWGCLNLMKVIKKKKRQSEKGHQLAAQYEKDARYVFLESIYNTPGLQNKKLAELCAVSTARISQIANEAEQDGLVSARVFGKEKCYFIRTFGESVYEIISNQRKPMIRNAGDVLLNYKMIVFSNDENDFNLKLKLFQNAIGKYNPKYRIAVAIAISEKPEELQTQVDYKIEEGKFDLWEKRMKFMNRSCRDF